MGRPPTAIPLLQLAGLPWHSAGAAAAEEEQMLKAPAPHEHSGASGPRVKVHRSHLHGYVAGKAGNAALLADLQAEVKACASGERSSAYPAKPPKVWPSHRQAYREDIYLAVNRRIVYSRHIYYTVRAEDCGLRATETATASLTSAKGICQIDLVNKVAKGDCDASGHADAPPPPAGPGPGPMAQIKQLEANPATAPIAAQLRALMATSQHRNTGKLRQVAGLRCEVWTYANAGTQGSMCYAAGGFFQPVPEGGAPDLAGLLLDIDVDTGPRASAVDARLDTEVGNSVFTPYKAPGYQLQRAAKAQ